MRKFLVSIAFVLAFLTFSFAQDRSKLQDPEATISIVLSDRVPNMAPGFCSWSSIETLANHHRIEKLYNLVQNRAQDGSVENINGKPAWTPNVTVEDDRGRKITMRNNYGNEWMIARKLESLNVPFYFQHTGDTNLQLIEYAMQNGLGCVINIRAGVLAKEPHAVVLTKFDKKTGIRYVDTNNPDWNYSAGIDWFWYGWTGYVLVIPK